MLTWKKRKDGSLIARQGKEVFTIVLHPPKGVRTYDLYVLFREGAGYVYSACFDRGKGSCKRVAEVVSSGKKPIFVRVLKSLPKKSLQALFTYYMKEVHNLHKIPVIEGPAKALFRKHALAGTSPANVVRDPTVLDKAKIDRDDLPDEYIDALTVELWPLYYPKVAESLLKEYKLRRKEVKQEKKPTKAPSANHPQSEEKVPEQYSGESPEERDTEHLMRLEVVSQSHPLPFKPEDAKFLTLFKWAEKVRDYFQIRGKYASLSFLKYAVKYCSGWNFERGDKASGRLELIYQDEDRVNKARMELMYRNSGKVVESEDKPKIGKDRWGSRIGSKIAKINATITEVPKSVKKIRKESGVYNVVGHLRSLCDRKLAKKTEDGKYRLFKRKKGKI